MPKTGFEKLFGTKPKKKIQTEKPDVPSVRIDSRLAIIKEMARALDERLGEKERAAAAKGFGAYRHGEPTFLGAAGPPAGDGSDPESEIAERMSYANKSPYGHVVAPGFVPLEALPPEVGLRVQQQRSVPVPFLDPPAGGVAPSELYKTWEMGGGAPAQRMREETAYGIPIAGLSPRARALAEEYMSRYNKKPGPYE